MFLNSNQTLGEKESMLEAMLHLIYDAQTYRYVLVQTNELENYHQQFFRYAWKTPRYSRYCDFQPHNAVFRFFNPDDSTQSEQAKWWYEQGERTVAVVADNRQILPKYARTMICCKKGLSFLKMFAESISAYQKAKKDCKDTDYYDYAFYTQLYTFCIDFKGVYHSLTFKASGDERMKIIIEQIKAKMPSTDTSLWWLQANSPTKDEKEGLLKLIHTHRVPPLGFTRAAGFDVMADGLFESAGDNTNSDEMVVNLMYRVSTGL